MTRGLKRWLQGVPVLPGRGGFGPCFGGSLSEDPDRFGVRGEQFQHPLVTFPARGDPHQGCPDPRFTDVRTVAGLRTPRP